MTLHSSCKEFHLRVGISDDCHDAKHCDSVDVYIYMKWFIYHVVYVHA